MSSTPSDNSSRSHADANKYPSEAQSLTKHRADSKSRELARAQFWHVVNEKWATVREECSKHWNSPDAATRKDCQFEKSVMREHIEVFEHGVVMTMVIFGTLRLTAHPKFKVFAENYVRPFFRLTPPPRKKPSRPPPIMKDSVASSPAGNFKPQKHLQQQNTNGSKEFAPKKSLPGNQETRQFKSHLEKQRDAHVKKVNEALEAPHDLLVATLVGLSTTFLFTRPKQMRLDFEEAPLSPGRSFLSEQLCDDFISIYRNTDPKVFEFGSGDKPDSTLKSFQIFANNCILRKNFVEKRKNVGVDKPLVLPSPGPWDDEEVTEEYDGQ